MMIKTKHVYEVRPRKDKRGVDLISDVLPFGRLWYGEPNASPMQSATRKHPSRSRDDAIRVYDETLEYAISWKWRWSNECQRTSDNEANRLPKNRFRVISSYMVSTKRDLTYSTIL